MAYVPNIVYEITVAIDAVFIKHPTNDLLPNAEFKCGLGSIVKPAGNYYNDLLYKVVS